MKQQNKRWIGILGAGLLLVGLNAQATPLVLTPGDCITGIGGNCWTSADNSGWDADKVETLSGTGLELFLAYKGDADGDPDEGYGEAWYDTTFENSNEDALIEWDDSGVEKIIGDEIYLLVKDGIHDPAVYLFDISTWDGEMAIDLNGFWTGSGVGGSISHVAIFAGVIGGGTPPTGIPEPNIIFLLGLGLAGLGAARRLRSN